MLGLGEKQREWASMTIYGLKEFPYLKPLQQKFPLLKYELDRIDKWLTWGAESPGEDGKATFVKGGDWQIAPLYIGEGRSYIEGVPAKYHVHAHEQLKTQYPMCYSVLSKIPQIAWAALVKLDPHTDIETHIHDRPETLKFHMGYVIPPGGTCGLKAEDAVHIWQQPGECIIFDGDKEHSAWNHSDQERIIFYCAIDRPPDFNSWT